MNISLSLVIDTFRCLDVLVIGDAMLDTYLHGTSSRVCREAPVPIVAVSDRHDAPGGAANTAGNAAALGARVHFLSVVGDDPEEQRLRGLLEERSVATDDLVVDPSRGTLAKNRVVAASQLLVRFDLGSTGPVEPEREQDLVDRLNAIFPRCDAVIVSDYGYGVLTPRVLETLRHLQRHSPRTLVADSKDLCRYQAMGLTAVKPNYEEAIQLIGKSNEHVLQSRTEWSGGRGERLLERTGARLAAVTLDVDGAVIVERGQPPYRTFAKPTRHARAAGAGDTFLATFALALAAGADSPAAADLASAACAVAVGRDGTTACSARELRAHLATEMKPAANLDDLVRQLALHRRDGRRVVFTNGCFDILHRGHITYLSQAKALGDILVVGVNSDGSIRRLKGPDRPINALDDRLEVLAALSCVDHVIAFDDDTPCELVRAVRPDLFVKGGDYTLDRLPEAAIVRQYGGEVRILPFVAERSTTDLIERIRAVGGGHECQSATVCSSAGDGMVSLGGPGAGHER